MTKRKILLIILIFISTNIYSQDFFTHFQDYMKPRLPEGWSMRQWRDSIFAFNKLVHWEEMMDPPPDSYGYNDTMTMFVHFHPVQNDSAQILHAKILDDLKIQMNELKEHRMDSVYRGKRGFYKWWAKMVHIEVEQGIFTFSYFNNCSLTFSYWKLHDGLKYYEEQVDKEAEMIKQTLVDYLNN